MVCCQLEAAGEELLAPWGRRRSSRDGGRKPKHGWRDEEEEKLR